MVILLILLTACQNEKEDNQKDVNGELSESYLCVEYEGIYNNTLVQDSKGDKFRIIFNDDSSLEFQYLDNINGEYTIRNILNYEYFKHRTKKDVFVYDYNASHQSGYELRFMNEKQKIQVYNGLSFLYACDLIVD